MYNIKVHVCMLTRREGEPSWALNRAFPGPARLFLFLCRSQPRVGLFSSMFVCIVSLLVLLPGPPLLQLLPAPVEDTPLLIPLPRRRHRFCHSRPISFPTIPPLLLQDLRRCRSGMLNLAPTSTGSATAIATIFPELKGKLNGLAIRVPMLNASITDCVFEVPLQLSV